MAQLYSDENVHSKIISLLCNLGHDVLTAQKDGKANQGIEDSAVLARAIELDRIILTNNRKHFHHFHESTKGTHAGIVTFTMDLQDIEGVTKRIHEKLEENPDMKGKLIRVIKPNRKKS